MPRIAAPQYVLNGVEFARLEAEDVRALSVTKITQQTTMTEYQKPAVQGLYDLRLGSFQAERYYISIPPSPTKKLANNPPVAQLVMRRPGTAKAILDISTYQ
jgi:hypothetical protein